MFKSVFWTALYTTPLIYFGLQTLIAETNAPFLFGVSLAIVAAAGIFGAVLYHDRLYNLERLRWGITMFVGLFGLSGIAVSIATHSSAFMDHLIVSASVVGIVIVFALLLSYGEVVSELYARLLRAHGKFPQRALRAYEFLSVRLPVSRRILFLRFVHTG